jgi:hypothetical protein
MDMMIGSMRVNDAPLVAFARLDLAGATHFGEASP